MRLVKWFRKWEESKLTLDVKPDEESVTVFTLIQNVFRKHTQIQFSIIQEPVTVF